MLWTYKDVNLAPLLIRSTPIGPGCPSLQKYCSTGQYEKSHLESTGHYYFMSTMTIYSLQSLQYVKIKRKLYKDNDTLKEHAFILMGPTVFVQREDSRPRTHCMITEHGDDEHNDRSYNIQRQAE